MNIANAKTTQVLAVPALEVLNLESSLDQADGKLQKPQVACPLLLPPFSKLNYRFLSLGRKNRNCRFLKNGIFDALMHKLKANYSERSLFFLLI